MLLLLLLLLYPQGNSPWHPLDRRLHGHQNQSGCGDEENSQPLPGLKPLIIQSVAQCYTTELSQLLMVLSAYTFKAML
jgi:hypothetical protein